ncbi:hypothetical protein Zmor_008725, partial [Zophobas morio]
SERKLSAPGSLDSPESLSAIPPVQSPSSSSVDEGSEGSSDDLKTADSLLQESNSRDQILNVADLQSPLFSIYLDFVKNYSKALETLRTRRRQNVQFEEFIMDMQSTLKANYKRYGLSDLLIMPIQRIPRYSLLLQALKKSTSRSHPDYQGLTSSIAIVDDIAMQVNEGQRHAENMEEFYNLLQRIKGEEHPEVEGREFVMMDKVVELYDSYKLRRWVYLVLFKDFLLCTKNYSSLLYFSLSSGGINEVRRLFQTPTSTSRKPTWGCTSTVELSNCLALRFVCLSEVLDKQEVIVGSSLILTEEVSRAFLFFIRESKTILNRKTPAIW